MKKTLSALLSVFLLLLLFVSCAQENDSVLMSIVHSNAKSQYECIGFVGNKGDKTYVLTKKHGIISFTFDKNGKASDIEELKTSKKPVDYAYVSNNVVYCLDRFGSLFTITIANGDKETLIGTGYKFLSDGYAVKSNGDLYSLSTNTPEKVDSVSGITKLISSIYFQNNTGVFEGEAPILTTTKTIIDIIKVESSYFVVVYEDSSYNVYTVENKELKTKIATLSSEPTASVYLSNNLIAYKTTSSIDIVDITKTTEDNPTSKTDGWASNLYTSTTEIYQFVTINEKLYSLNASGGMTYIDLKNDEAKQIFDK